MVCIKFIRRTVVRFEKGLIQKIKKLIIYIYKNIFNMNIKILRYIFFDKINLDYLEFKFGWKVNIIN